MSDTMPSDKSATRGKIIKLIAAVILILALLIAARFFNLQQVFRDVLDRISQLGLIGLMIFIVIYILACVLMLPGAILTLGAGVIFGVITGSVVVSIGSTIGAVFAFLIGRYLARDWVAGKITANEKFRAVDEAVAREGWKIVLLTRLSPVFPFNLLNYSFGLTKVRLSHYTFASWVGMIPGTVMYVYIGSLPGEWMLYAVGLLATVAVTVYVTRLARKALAGRVPLEQKPQ